MQKFITAAAIIITTVMMINAQTKTVVLQQGLNGYTGCQDKELRNPAKSYFRGPEDRVLVLSEH